MNDRDAQLYAEASDLAKVAMGRNKVGRGRCATRYWIADEDRLAWWELTEAIASIALRHAARGDIT